MNGRTIYPFRLRPVYKERIWGGRNLARLLHKELPGGVAVGESWEVADDAVVADGPLAGRQLAEVTRELGSALVGTLAESRYGRVFPLLIKFIDAQDRLSVQVHPDDVYARHEEGETFGKTEMWYVLDAAEGAEIIHGIESDNLAADDLTRLARDGGLVEHLSRVKVEAGDVVFIPAGTVHAMGAGLLVCEVQQNSDLTYRFYDWGRRDSGGQPRALHVAKAVAVSRQGPREHKIPPLVVERPYGRLRPLAACRYFAVELIELTAPLRGQVDGRSFAALCVLGGAGELVWQGGGFLARCGDSLLIPAATGEYELRPTAAPWRVLLARVPDLLLDVVQPLLAAGVERAAILRLGGDLATNDLAGLLG